MYRISCFRHNNSCIGQTYRLLGEHEKNVAKATICISKKLFHTPSTKKNNKIIAGRIEEKELTQPLRPSTRLINQQIKSQTQNKPNQNDIFYYKPNSAL